MQVREYNIIINDLRDVQKMLPIKFLEDAIEVWWKLNDLYGWLVDMDDLQASIWTIKLFDLLYEDGFEVDRCGHVVTYNQDEIGMSLHDIIQEIENII